MRRSRATAALLAAGLLLAAGAGASPRRQAALGPGGELYVVRAGSYGDLFSSGVEAAADTPVLALDVVRPDGGIRRLLVAGTEGPAVESFPSVLFEEASGSAYLLWEGREYGIWSSLHLVSYRDGAWSEVLEVSGDPFSWKSAPQLAVTQDTFELPAEDGGTRTYQRRILHVVWWEDSGPGERAAYAPLVLLDGEYGGSNPVFLLGDFDTSDAAGTGATPAPSLYRSPAVEPGEDGSSVVVAHTDLRTGRFVTLTIRHLPQELSYLADEARANIIAVGAGDSGLSAVADEARANIIAVGARLNLLSWLVESIGEQTRRLLAERIAADPGVGIEALADEARANIIAIGSSLLRSGLQSTAAAARANIVAIGARAVAGSLPTQLAAVSVASARPAPETEPGAATTTYLSPDGKRAIVAWEAEGRLRYRETTADGWSEVFGLSLGADLSLEEAHRVLEQRARDR